MWSSHAHSLTHLLPAFYVEQSIRRKVVSREAQRSLTTDCTNIRQTVVE